MKPILMLLAAFAVVNPAFSQEDERKSVPDPKFYRLEFVLKELEGGKVTNSRTYILNISPTAPFQGSSVRVTNRVVVPVSAEGNVTTVELGVSLDCKAMKATENSITLQINADISTLTPTSTPGLPITNQNRWNVGATVPLRKATTLVSADGATNKRQMQLEVTATPL
jgi:hypothetical protein